MKRPAGAHARALLLFLPLVSSCTRTESNAPLTVGPRSSEPEIRIGLGVGLATVTLGGGSALAVIGAGGVPRAEVPSGASVTATSADGGLRFSGALSWSPAPGESLSFSPVDPGGFITLGSRNYRGAVMLFAGRDGITAVNRLGLESYLAGVVSAEMGRRDSLEEQAVMAQAVVSRTYALRNRGRWKARAFPPTAGA